MKTHNYPKRKSKYTTEHLQIIKNCKSVREALTMLNLSPDGGHKELRKSIKEILICSGSYKGQAYSKDTTFIRISNEDFFCYADRASSKIKDALFARGLKEKKCEKCNNETWMGEPIPLEAHHKDGDKKNNYLYNLEILCPNCHALTDTYKIKNRKIRQ